MRKDDLTAELPGVTRRRGRPPTGKAKSGSQRQQEYLARLKDQGRVVVPLELPIEVVEALDKYRQFKDMTRGDAVEKALRERFMRKR